jgi:hypothetical protein
MKSNYEGNDQATARQVSNIYTTTVDLLLYALQNFLILLFTVLKAYNSTITLAGLYIRISEYSTFSWICFRPEMDGTAWR